MGTKIKKEELETAKSEFIELFEKIRRDPSLETISECADQIMIDAATIVINTIDEAETREQMEEAKESFARLFKAFEGFISEETKRKMAKMFEEAKDRAIR